LGRNIPRLLKLAQDLPINIIVATGAYYFDELPGFFQSQNADVLSECFVKDVTEGIQGTINHKSQL
jgi:phosphotriesterase-related protein